MNKHPLSFESDFEYDPYLDPNEEMTGRSYAQAVKAAVVNDPVNSPSHYKKGQFEVIEIIDECVPDPYSYYMGNAIKYLLRHQDKGKPKQDLEKCKWYIDRMIDDWRNN